MWTLVIWTVVAVQGTGTGNHMMQEYRDWRPVVSNIQNEAACHKAAKQLGYTSEKQYRCISQLG